MKKFEEINYKLDKDNIYKEYIRAFKYIWEQCTCYPDEIFINYNSNAANFKYTIKDISLCVLITKDNLINYEISYKSETKRYEFKTKENFELFDDFKYYLLYHFDRLLKSCYNCAIDTTGYFKASNVDCIYECYKSML